jgi:integrase
MAVKRLTKRTVEATPATGKRAYVWDTELRGFGVIVTEHGRRVYVVQYRLPGLGRRGFAKRVTIGEHGTVTTEQARDTARRLLASVTTGGDPAASRRARKEAPTMRELGDDFLADVQAHRKPRTSAEYARLWGKHVLPALATKKAADVTITDVRRVHRAMRETPYLANRVLALLGSAFAFAEREGVRARRTNPAHDVETYPEQSRERFLAPDEVKRLGEALTRAERDGLSPAPKVATKSRGMTKARRAKLTGRKRGPYKLATASHLVPANPYAVAAIRLLMLTGCRESEVLTLRWDAVDLERGFLRLADTKTGRSVRPLGAAAAELLASLPRVDGSPYVFPGAKEGQPLKETSRLWYAVRHAAGLDDVRLHDLRHSFASVSALGGDSLLLTRTLLGHKNIKTTSKYAHLGDDPAKAAADRAAGAMSSWLAGGTTPITPLRKADAR